MSTNSIASAPVHKAPAEKLRRLDAELAAIVKRQAKIQERFSGLRKEHTELDRRRYAIGTQRNAVLLREHIGKTVELNGGDAFDLSWVDKRGELVSVGRTRALIDFGEGNGDKYRGKWYWPIDALRPVQEDVAQ